MPSLRPSLTHNLLIYNRFHTPCCSNRSPRLGTISYNQCVKWRFAICIFTVLAAVGCSIFNPDEERERHGCRTTEISNQLERVFYWGTEDWLTIHPNKGYTWIGIDEPTWIDPSTIVVFTGTYVGDDWVRGLFKIQIDDQTLAYEDYEAFAFPFCIASVSYHRTSGRLLVIYNDGGPVAGSVSLSGGKVIVDTELVGPDWAPRGVSGCGTSEDIIFYGRNPNDGVWGFFRRKWSGAQATDSLLLPIVLTEDSMQKFAVDNEGEFLYFGQTGEPPDDFLMRIMKLDLSQPGALLDTLLTRPRGYAVSMRPNPQDNDLLLVQYYFIGGAHDFPDGKVLLLNTETLGVKDFNVRTQESLCQFTTNDNVSWSPDGNNFAFSAGAFDGEGGSHPRELWVYRDAR
jgi:hypothetical protein